MDELELYRRYRSLKRQAQEDLLEDEQIEELERLEDIYD